MNYLLSKSDFTTARSCYTKLFYKKKGYPDTKSLDEFMRYLAEGGYMVGKLATLKYSTGIPIETGDDHLKAIELTNTYLKQENITLFEAAILSDRKLVRVDILEKKGNLINLIEVKSKSFDSADDEKIKKEMKAKLKEKFEDVAYQYYVLREAHPEYTIKPYLFLPDKNKRTSVEGLNLLFRIKDVSTGTRFRKFEVSVDESKIEEINNDDIMTLLDVEEEVLNLQEMVRAEADELLKSFGQEINKILVPLSKECFKCEFNTTNKEHIISGFDECWKDKPPADHHIKDLHKVGALGGWKNPLANKWIEKGITSMFDIPTKELIGVIGERNIIQIKHTKDNTEWMGSDFYKSISDINYPLHFIDFETFLGALPFHKNMRPYELVAFQWSCHTINKPGDDPLHSEWINLQHGFPSFRFAESLMNQIELNGTPLMWSPYENTVLKTIYNQIDFYDYDNPDLKNWLEKIVKFEKDDGRLFDMEKIVLKQYFHPKMKGRTSIKVVLPAILSNNNSSRIIKWLDNFEPNLSLLKIENKSIVNPYTLLPHIDIYEKSEQINEGTGAMRAYGELMFGLRKEDKEAMTIYKDALLKYCKLDTLAMVIIWEYWNNRIGENK